MTSINKIFAHGSRSAEGRKKRVRKKESTLKRKDGSSPKKVEGGNKPKHRQLVKNRPNEEEDRTTFPCERKYSEKAERLRERSAKTRTRGRNADTPAFC